MKRLLASSLLFLMPVSALASEPKPGFTQRVDAIFAGHGGKQPGCAVGVYRSGQLIFAKGYGLADLGTGAPITPATLFNVASLSKQFTAFAIALLVREGRLSLDDEVQAHVPELPRFAVPMTIRHLVHHTSGLRDYGSMLELTGWRYDQRLSREQVLSLFRRQRQLNFMPGERHEYNSSNYVLLALIIERVSGQSLAAFTRQRIFGPLGMSRTIYRDDPASPRPVRATNYTRGDNGQWNVNHVWDKGYGAGAVAVHTSLEDLAGWDRNFLSPTVGDESLIRMVTTGTRLSSGKTLDYGFGVYLNAYRGLKAVSHAGQGGGTFYYMQLPEKQLSVATLCNRYSLGRHATDSAALTWAVVDLLIDNQAEPADSMADASPEIALPPARLAAHAGDYWRDTGAPIRIRFEGGRLVEHLNGNADPLIPTAPDRFRSPDGKARYVFSGENGQTLTYSEPSVGLVSSGTRQPPWSPSAHELARFAGTYCTSEVPVCWTLQARGGSLRLRRPGFADRTLQPAWPGTFSLVDSDDIGARTMRLTVPVTTNGEIGSFAISRGRISGLSFERAQPSSAPTSH